MEANIRAELARLKAENDAAKGKPVHPFADPNSPFFDAVDLVGNALGVSTGPGWEIVEGTYDETLTLTKVRAELKPLGITIKRLASTNEYRVNFAAAEGADDEEVAYYTNDLQDALDTGRMLAKAAS